MAILLLTRNIRLKVAITIPKGVPVAAVNEKIETLLLAPDTTGVSGEGEGGK